MQIIKREHVMEAHRWIKNGDHPHDGDPKTEGTVVRYYRHPDVAGDKKCRSCTYKMHDHGWLDTEGGGLIVHPYDGVVTQKDGTYTVYSPDHFSREFKVIPEPPESPERHQPFYGLPKHRRKQITLTKRPYESRNPLVYGKPVIDAFPHDAPRINAHDVNGIVRYLNRDTLTLRGNFVPRCIMRREPQHGKV